MSNSSSQKEGGKQENPNHYHVSVYHTGTLTGAPDLHEEQVSAQNEQQAIERAKTRPGWPEDEYYDSNEDIEVKEL